MVQSFQYFLAVSRSWFFLIVQRCDVWTFGREIIVVVRRTLGSDVCAYVVVFWNHVMSYFRLYFESLFEFLKFKFSNFIESFQLIGRGSYYRDSWCSYPKTRPHSTLSQNIRNFRNFVHFTRVWYVRYVSVRYFILYSWRRRNIRFVTPCAIMKGRIAW